MFKVKVVEMMVLALFVSVGCVLILYMFQGFLVQLGATGLFVFMLLFYVRRKWEEDDRLKMASIMKDAPIAIMIVKEHKIVNLNQKALNLLMGSKKRVIRGKDVTEFISFSNNQLTKVSGETVDVELQKASEGLQEKNHTFVLFIKDLQQDKEKEALIQHYEQLSVLGELAAGIAHEIRNPITSLKGFLQLIETDHSNSSSKSYTKIMLSEIERINLIVSELLVLGKPKELNKNKHHFFEIIQLVVTLTKTQAIIYNIEIKFNFDPSLKHVNIYCDDNKLKQVFINIIRNAIEAMKKEGTIVIDVTQVNDRLKVAFIDEGKGIPKEKMESIGKQFFTTKENGTGLGLMISNHIIKEHNGNMTMESEEGKGTKVFIELPINS
ncbi:hypothetical protein JCM9140_2137 [Halalkalibacter wakoensis JCM 9140]|uniref:histidine kinase n=1 Tax=Halalkalibacter wakoensis JCM 9140 TaxID=1236970 RepID=W4Q418_9BACI|nr:ATP-binding protein [Halalkalibacter wakoensis]GAE26109.1 hypothetical protein JCM9140_2137 [Halalkalibacter wakoensis JCM 9140]